MKPAQQSLLWFLVISLILSIILLIGGFQILLVGNKQTIMPYSTPNPSFAPSPSPTLLPSPTVLPSPLTFAEMNILYGPCAYVPTLFYHHIENMNQAKIAGHAQLTVSDDFFRQQLQYLKDKGYTVIRMTDVINFFDLGSKLPPKSILLTIDDGYSDVHSFALPILREFGFSGTLFLPTGLVGNPGYLSWNEVEELENSGLMFIANHTWSHKNVAVAKEVMEKEISTADTQLSQHGLNIPKVFAYPYGIERPQAIAYLNQLNYKLAFTTEPGRTLCKLKRLELPRVRIGNSNLSAYGL